MAGEAVLPEGSFAAGFPSESRGWIFLAKAGQAGMIFSNSKVRVCAFRLGFSVEFKEFGDI